jgi:mono/diheme cytochrome c family protein
VVAGQANRPVSHRRWIGVLAGVIIAAAALRYLLGPGPLAFAGGPTVAPGSYAGTDPSGVPAGLAQADLVSRGRYLTEAADCEACHTTPGGPAFAGGRAFKTPFGTLYSPNLTADRDTGLGAWTDADFVRALHRGVRPDGVHLYPAFPYAAYTYLSDADVRAIRAYLLSLPAVKYRAPPAELAFPFNQRWLMGIWASLYNADERYRPHSERSAAWNRGAYLAEALAHCGECHTPRNLLQALDNRRKYAGAVTAGWSAYNITPDATAGVGTWSDADLAQYLASGHAHSHGSAGGPMAEAVDLSLSRLAPEDIAALVTYLRSVPARPSRGLPALQGALASNEPAVPAGLDPLGKEVFAGACASCHGWSGASALSARATLTGSRAVNDPTAINVAQMVLNGSHAPRIDGSAAMPGFGAAYSDAEIAAVANYVTARFGAKGSSITPAQVAKLRETS